MEHYYGNKHELKATFLAIFKEIGVIAPACKKAGISTSTFYRWYNNPEDIFSQDFNEATEQCLETHGKLLRGIPKHKRYLALQALLYEEDAEKEKQEEAYRKFINSQRQAEKPITTEPLGIPTI